MGLSGGTLSRLRALGDPTYLIAQPGKQRALRFLALILIGQRLSYLVLAAVNAMSSTARDFRSQVLNGTLLSVAVVWTMVFVLFAWQRGWFPRWTVLADIALSCALMWVVTANCPPGFELTSMNWSPKMALATASLIGAALAGRQALVVSLIPMAGYVIALTEHVGPEARLFPGLIGHLNSCVWFGLLLFFMRNYLCRQSKALDEAVAQRVAVERERARVEERMAHHRQLHDTVLATLTAIARGGLDHRREQVRKRCGKDAEYVRRLILEDRSASTDGLADELGGLIAEAEEAGLRVHHMNGDVPEELPSRVVAAFVGATREALNNVVKHSGADQVWLTCAREDEVLVVRVVDRGEGFDQEHNADGFGLRWSIRERMVEVGGELELFSMPGNGTSVELRWPAHPAERTSATPELVEQPRG
ncbi:sensor histidine kinase [Allokutzneria multivorans]|uniref:sensor histidine kinase n=1 Tax=Allokutzneria multivorans TaxID=1142134 RepID=UPI0031E67E5C